MTWEKPEVFEIKMDAEIGSYQLDDEGPQFAFAAREEKPTPSDD
jgi:hypothetical protein